MKFLLFAGIVAVGIASLAFADNLHKIKLVNASTPAINREYVNLETYKLEVAKVNETYNRLIMNYDVIKDAPLNTVFEAEVFLSNTECKNYEKIHDYAISLCDKEDKYFQYLPNEFIELNKAGFCVPKGQYHVPDHSVFKFYNLLSEEELENACFKLICSLKSEKVALYSTELEFVSV